MKNLGINIFYVIMLLIPVHSYAGQYLLQMGNQTGVDYKFKATGSMSTLPLPANCNGIKPLPARTPNYQCTFNGSFEGPSVGTLSIYNKDSSEPLCEGTLDGEGKLSWTTGVCSESNINMHYMKLPITTQVVTIKSPL